MTYKMEAINIPVPLRSTSERVAFISLIFLSGLIVYVLAIVVYRLYFHPLAKFPGPFFNAISDVGGLEEQKSSLTSASFPAYYGRYAADCLCKPESCMINMGRWLG